MRHRPAPLAAALACALTLIAAPRPTVAGSWPGLRGPSHDGTVRDAALFDGGTVGLEVAWRRTLGSGYPVVVADDERLIAVFQSAAKDVAAAFDPETGDELWRYEIGDAWAGHTGSHDGPIATPALAGGRLFGLGPRGHLFALDAVRGDALWTRHLVDELGAETPFYGFASSPVVAGGVVVVQMGAGEGRSIGGFDAASGEPLWATGDDEVSYHSPVLATLGGRFQVVAAGKKRLIGLDPASGAVLWSHEHGGDERAMGGETIVPVPAGENRLLLLHSHPESVMVQVEPGDGGAWQVRELWKSNAIKATYVLPVYHDGYLYGMNSKIFTCVDAATGETRWRAREPGDGFPTLVGDHLVIMTKAGVLRVAEASPEGYRELAALELFDDLSWSAPAFAGGRLYVRSMGSLARIDPATAAAAAAASARSMAETSFARFLERLDRVENKRALIEAYLAANAPLPVIEHTGAVHFLFHGDARDVGIVGDMIGFRREDPMIRVPGTDLFYYSTRLEPDAAVHYGFLVDYGEPIPDPLNPRRASGLFGEVSFVAMPARRVPDGAGEVPEARRGRLEELTWESQVLAGQKREARVYLPAGFDPDSGRLYPTLYVHDGHEALEKGGFRELLDHSIGDGVRPLIAVFVVPDPEKKRGELRDPKYTRMLLDELVPLVDGRYPTIDDPMARGTAGVAGAADLSLALAFDQPDRFARVGAIWPVLFAFEAEPPEADHSPLVLYHTWGSYHVRSPHENFDSAEANRQLWRQLRERGYRPAGGEVPEGFGWSCWRGYTAGMLRALFPAG